ncbi:aminoglycoside phosphotransferase family protein [Nocardia gamkensis]|uniref:aminoglycoside phosphotransferase family protein n=1 Tax=Nocardia gamkensis TaxID=352869 RepID=UPI0037C50668
MSDVLQQPLPTVVELSDLTTEAVTAILRRTWDTPAEVSEVRAERFGLGQTADSYRLHLSFDGDRGEAPATVVAKFASEDPASRQIGRMAGLYEREANFYRDLSHTVAVRTPQLVHAEAADDGRFALLMEDVAPAQMVDQIDGCSAERAAVAMQQAAALHGSSWRRPDLAARPWLRSFIPVLQATVNNLPDHHAQFAATYAGLVDRSILDITAAVVAAAPTWFHSKVHGYSLWHHDFRPDNMLFDAHNGRDPLVLVDWQTVSYGPGIADVAYFLGCGLTIEDRRAHERELIGIYHDGLVAAGVDELTRDECWASYLDHALAGLFMAIHASVRVVRTERGDQMWKSWLERGATLLTDHDALARY